MPTPAKYNLVMPLRTDFEKTFLLDFDISSISFYSQVRDKQDNLKAQFTITKSVENEITLSLPKQYVDQLSAGVYDYDIKLLNSGKLTQIIYGTVTVEPSPTEV